jgi:hypothetical protein
LAQTVPQVQPIIVVLQWLAGLVGGVGVVQATAVGTLSQAKLSGIASILAALVAIAQFIPALAPYVPLLEKLAAMFGAMGVGAAVGTQRMLARKL